MRECERETRTVVCCRRVFVVCFVSITNCFGISESGGLTAVTQCSFTGQNSQETQGKSPGSDVIWTLFLLPGIFRQLHKVDAAHCIGDLGCFVSQNALSSAVDNNKGCSSKEETLCCSRVKKPLLLPACNFCFSEACVCMCVCMLVLYKTKLVIGTDCIFESSL